MTRDPIWREVSEAHYDEMLGVVPPALMTGLGFLVGEPMRHNRNGEPEFCAFANMGGRFFAADVPLTIREFRALGGSPVMLGGKRTE
jgi:hypothetical protein